MADKVPLSKFTSYNVCVRAWCTVSKITISHCTGLSVTLKSPSANSSRQ